MASNSTKSFLADAGYGEQELDANSALMELDKGISKERAARMKRVWGEVAPPGGGNRARKWGDACAVLLGGGGGWAPLLLVSPGLFAALGGWQKTAALLGWPCTAEKVESPRERLLWTTWGCSPAISQTISESGILKLWNYFSLCAIKTRSSPRLLHLAPTLQRFIWFL